MSDRNTLYCNFCGKSQHEVHKLVMQPPVFICNECVDLCFDIILADDIAKGLSAHRLMTAADIGIA